MQGPRPRSWTRKLEVDALVRPRLLHPGLYELGRRRPAALHLHRLARGELVRLLFHELAHQVVYVPDDTLFNESFATAVERLGSAQWLSTEASAQTRAAFAESSERRSAFRVPGAHHPGTAGGNL